MKKIYTAIAAGVLLLNSAATLNAQCGGNRFHNFVFSTNTITSNVQYGVNLKANGTSQNLLMDIYQPTGDSSVLRPLVIVAHGGSFIGGSKTGPDVVPLCKDLAKLGYVTASIEYRVGMTNFPFPGPDSADAGAAVMRAVHDGRAAVRFFRKNVATGGNTYKIDVNNIYFAGVSAGGFISLHLAYMDQLAEFPAFVDTSAAQPGLGGGIEGYSGNPGYSSDVKAIINVCGAIGDTAWIHAGDEPLLSFHGTADNTVPYGSSLITLAGLYPLLEVDGSSSVAARANQVGLENCFEIWEGQDHVPEVGTSGPALAYYDSMLVMTRNFLEHQVCGVPLNCSYTTPITSVVGIEEASIEDKISIYPNPASTSLTIDLGVFENADLRIDMYDALGKHVKSVANPKTDKIVIARDGLKNGMYLITITSGGNHYSKRVVLE